MILHITPIDNIADGQVHDPARIKHGIVMGNRVSDLSWWIDPATHLNLDLPGELLDEVVVVSRLEKGSRVLAEGKQLMFAPVDPRVYRHLGKVDITEKRRVSLKPSIHG
jgi:hypothetical protein